MKRYPKRPGHRGQDTSIAAAEAFSERLEALRARCYAVILKAGEKGLTTAEVEDKLGRRRLEQRPFDPRIADLKRTGLIVDSGQRRLGRCGVLITVWIAVPQPSVAVVSPQGPKEPPAKPCADSDACGKEVFGCVASKLKRAGQISHEIYDKLG